MHPVKASDLADFHFTPKLLYSQRIPKTLLHLRLNLWPILLSKRDVLPTPLITSVYCVLNNIFDAVGYNLRKLIQMRKYGGYCIVLI